MQILKTVVACSDIKTERRIYDFLSTFGYEVLSKTQYGFNCLSDIIELKPDVVICDAFIYDLDACRLYEQLKSSGYSDEVVFVVVSSVTDSSFINDVLNCGVDYFSLLPTDFVSLDERIRSIVISKKQNLDKTKQFNSKEFDIKTHIKSLLREMGLSSGIFGYDYLTEAVYMGTVNSSGVKLEITKDIYPSIANKHKTTAKAVERAMRSAIEKSWLLGNVTLINEIFGYSIDSEKSRPSNNSYIASLAEKVKTDLKIQ